MRAAEESFAESFVYSVEKVQGWNPHMGYFIRAQSRSSRMGKGIN